MAQASSVTTANDGGTDRSGSGWLARLVTVALLAAPVGLVAYSFWPGSMSLDSLQDYTQARDGQFTNQRSLITNWLWSLVYPMGIGPGDLLVLAAAAFVVGCFLLLRPIMSIVVAALIAALIALSPMLIGALGYIQRDGQFTAALVLGFGLLAAALGAAGWHRGVLIFASLVVAWFLLALRQNGLPVALVLTVMAMAAVMPGRRWFVVAAAGLLMTFAMMASQWAIERTLSAQDVQPGSYIQVYDLASMSMDQNRNLFPASVMADQSMESINARYDVDEVVGIALLPDSPVQPIYLTEKQAGEVGRAWRAAVRDDPKGWAAVRMRVYLRLLGITRNPRYPFHLQIDPNPYELQYQNPSANQKAASYIRRFYVDQFDGGVVFRAWIYLLLCLVGIIVFLLRRRSPGTVAIGGAALAAVLYQAGYLIAAMATGYRFMLPVVAVGLVVAVALVASVVRRGRESARPQPAT